MMKLYGTEPLFIFDLHDPSNAPVRGYHDNALAYWPIYPQFLRDLFIRAFTDGIRDAQSGRVRETEWKSALVRLRDVILYCSHCGAENFYDPDMHPTPGSKGGTCWSSSCKREIRLPMQIRLGNTGVMLNGDTNLFPHHTDNTRLYDFTAPTAQVTQRPTDPNVWGLKNLSAIKWVMTTATGTMRDVEPGRSVTLALGTKIQFGNVEGEILAT
jgi:hypothetical protein